MFGSVQRKLPLGISGGELWHSSASWLFYWLSQCAWWTGETAAKLQVTNTVCVWQLVLHRHDFWMKSFFSVSTAGSRLGCSAPSKANAEVNKNCWFVQTHSFTAQYMSSVSSKITMCDVYLLPGIPKCKQPLLRCFKCEPDEENKKTKGSDLERVLVPMCKAVELVMCTFE